jgi:outer membrane protein assembly factor BamD
MRLLPRLLPILLLAILAGCGLLPEQIDETKSWSAQKLYSEAKQDLDAGGYTEAIELYDKLLARYPFGPLAQQAFLDKAYAHYRADEPDAAIATLDRFLRTYPRHPYADYAYYLKGVVNFTRGRDLVERYLPVDVSQRDQAAARESFFDFQELVTRYPNSPYAEDARQRMVYLRNLLADSEIEVADWYMRRGAYVAAANRAKHVVENFQETPQQEQALQIMIAAYDRLGLEELEADATRVLALNFPGAEVKEYEGDRPSLLGSLRKIIY